MKNLSSVYLCYQVNVLETCLRSDAILHFSHRPQQDICKYHLQLGYTRQRNTRKQSTHKLTQEHRIRWPTLRYYTNNKQCKYPKVCRHNSYPANIFHGCVIKVIVVEVVKFSHHHIKMLVVKPKNLKL